MPHLIRLIADRLAKAVGGPTDGTVVADAEGRAIVLDEITIRAVLIRMDALQVERVNETTVRVQACALDEAIADPVLPIHDDIPNRAAGAPRRAHRPLQRLRAVGRAAAARGDAVDLQVPAPVAAWSALRARRTAHELDRMWG